MKSLYIMLREKNGSISFCHADGRTDGIRFYNSASNRTRNEDGKKIYLYLASEEKNHLKKLEREYMRVAKKFFWIDKNELPEKGKLEKSVGYRLYEELAKMVSDERVFQDYLRNFVMMRKGI